jgi:prepilin peptidase CpaA
MPLSIYLFLLIELLIVGYLDFNNKKIYNYWHVLNIIAFVIFLIIFPSEYRFIIPTFIYSLVFLVVGFGLFMLKIMGAGDSKFLFSFFLLVPLPYHDEVFLYLLYSTVFVGSGMLISTVLHNYKDIKYAIIVKDLKSIKRIFGRKFPFAPLILLSWILLGCQRYKIILN